MFVGRNKKNEQTTQTDIEAIKQQNKNIVGKLVSIAIKVVGSNAKQSKKICAKLT